MPRRHLSAALVLAALTSAAAGQDPIDRIREADLKRDLFAMAGDDMRGREGGTLDEMAASAWVAERAREAGLQPAGDNGTYFQFFPLERFRVSASSPVTLGGKKLVMGRDVINDAVVLADIDAPVVVLTSEDMLVNPNRPAGAPPPQPAPLTGKVLVAHYSPAPNSAPATPPVGPSAPAALRNWARNV